MNRIYFGDNLPVLRHLPNESVDLIYIDPPFNTKKTQKRATIKTIRDENGDRKGFKGKTYRTIELGTKSYEDKFDSYIDEFLKPRVEEAYRLLKRHGSLYFHIDYREVHYCKIMLDQIFGRDCFLNEIIWAYDYGGRGKSRWPAKHDNILFYVKDPRNYIFNQNEVDKEPYMAPGLVGPEKAGQGKVPTDTWWAVYTGTNKPRSLSETWWAHYARGKNHTDVWLLGKTQPKGSSDTWWQTIVPTGSKERLGYPTQKPKKLIDRIIKASSLKGSTVLDFFAGSGTVGESCLDLVRDFILVDNNKVALEVMAERFSGEESIEWVNFDPKPYQINRQPRIRQPVQKPSKLSGDFIMLASVSNYLLQDQEDVASIWANSPFERILNLPPRKKGKLGKDLIKFWLTNKGLNVSTIKGASDILLLDNSRLAVKFSTLWANGVYKFQQIRTSGYDYLICLGISPFDAHCWIFERKYALEYSKPQHRGTRTADFWMEIDPSAPESWIAKYGGTLDKAFRVLNSLRKD